MVAKEICVMSEIPIPKWSLSSGFCLGLVPRVYTSTSLHLYSYNIFCFYPA